MTWLVAVAAVAWVACGVVVTREGHRRIESHRERVAQRSIEARHNRIAQLEIELGITVPVYANPVDVERAWQARWDAELAPGPPPPGFTRGWTDDERAKIEATRARRKAVARMAAQKRQRRS